ncbi:DEKNAAC101108 [Brettanomyces naardenensis]|uniref:Glucosidase 2 subunit beta n=1 Tax=Brettanomyces naardenensis TaxID=13370 RepID=A0A448YHJ3_BRENA|nr:DEKNAAC101108 [Brettanomyces naardenensis]
MKSILIALPATCLALESIRGVSPDLLKSKYQPDKDGYFHCLNDSTIAIPFSKVNDDYCDCPDGSDEPGTSACSNGRFYCINEGFLPHYIPSAWVDDGVCDYELCCDGSDEPEGTCENRCKEYAEAYEVETRKNEEKLKKGLQLKSKILEKSREQRQILVQEVEAISGQVVEMENRLQELEEEKSRSGSAGLKKVEEIFKPFEDVISGISGQLKEYSERLLVLEDTLRKMNEEYNHNFNDPAVKLAASTFQDYLANHEAVKKEDGDSTGDLNGKLEEVKEQIVKELVEGTTEFGADGLFGRLQQSAEQMMDEFLGVRKERKKISKGISLGKLEAEAEDAEKRLKDSRGLLEEKKRDLERSYGPDDILRSRTDCITNKFGEYKYRLCFTGKLEQIDGSQHAVRIGSYESAEIDEKTGELVIKYGGGEKCWNGPIRGAEVRAVCGVKDEILTVSEPEKCHYMIEMTSPVACAD